MAKFHYIGPLNRLKQLVMGHLDVFVSVRVRVMMTLLLLLSVACGKDTTSETTAGSGITDASWAETEEISPSGEEREFTFTSGTAWSATSNNPEWCEILTGSGQKGKATLHIAVIPNTTGAARTTIVRITAESFPSVSFKVRQQADSGGEEGKEGLEINRNVDEVLAYYYLWNKDYQELDRDLTLPYISVGDNFVYHTLMKMTTNTLDKKYHESSGSYSLYSYLVRTPSSSRASATRGEVNHGIRKGNPVPSFGVGQYAYVSFGNGQIGFCPMSIISGSPLDQAGFRRGDVIVKINGKTPTESTYASVFSKLVYPSEGTILTLTREGKTEEVSVTAVSLDPTPIIRAEVLEGTHVGYIIYESFDAAYDNDLLDAIKRLKEAGITDLILDLRYNGGGHVMTSNMLSTCIGGSRCQNRVYQYYRYNDDRMADWKQTSQDLGTSYDQEAQLFYERFYYANYYGARLSDYDLNIDRLFVLVSGNTASASEAVINSLRGIDMPVTLIGSKTNGKNVGMNVFSWSNVDGFDYEFAPISFQGYNAKKQSVDPKGITPDHAVDERATSTGWYVDFGPEEPLVHKALELIGVADATRTTRGTQRTGIRLEGGTQQALTHPQGMLCTQSAAEE